MAALESRKRRHNVRSSSSCSSNGSNENGLETGYVSDNSNSDVEMTNACREPRGKVGFFGKNGQTFSPCNVMRKEFTLNVNDSNEADCYKSSRKRSKCVSKNALNARANRVKKKQYLEGLETKVEELSQENDELKEQAKKNDEAVQKLNEELRYLKGVLANSREISMLLKTVHQSTGLPITSSVNKFLDMPNVTKETPFDMDFPEDPFFASGDLGILKTELPVTDLLEQDFSDGSIEEKTFEKDSSASIGICLHVAQHRVSLEFCSTCSNNASASWVENTG